jgi:hypothetical protein
MPPCWCWCTEHSAGERSEEAADHLPHDDVADLGNRAIAPQRLVGDKGRHRVDEDDQQDRADAVDDAAEDDPCQEQDDQEVWHGRRMSREATASQAAISYALILMGPRAKGLRGGLKSN